MVCKSEEGCCFAVEKGPSWERGPSPLTVAFQKGWQGGPAWTGPGVGVVRSLRATGLLRQERVRCVERLGQENAATPSLPW